MKKEDAKQRLELRLLVAICVFIILFISILVAAALIFFLLEFKFISIFDKNTISFGALILYMMISSWAIGGILTYFLLKFPLRPINYFISQMDRLTKGDFKTRIEPLPLLSNHPTIVEVTESFNKLAEELENTEMLRSEFINNFSHEFKTPIVSIAGFAKLLKRADLTNEQKREYIDIIEEESVRLATMATNVLNMTKVDNYTILTNITYFNISEQIRNSFILLEKKWLKKKINFDIDFDEHYIYANEELLKHVWINLLDNAIKFTEYEGLVEVSVTNNDYLEVVITNTGSEIPKDQYNRIFNKFYQIDESHATEGNGIGLSLVKKIVDLHQGEIQIDSKDNRTSFTIRIPNNLMNRV